MGGPGSGNFYRWDARRTTDEAHAIDVREWHHAGLLRAPNLFAVRWSRSGRETGSISVWVPSHDHVAFRYRARRGLGSDWQDIEQRVTIERTPCHIGGARPWFRCPACDRRVALLYGPGTTFACRHCYDLAYESTREEVYERQLRKAQAIRRRLGGSGNMLESFPSKPKGMHWKTYWRLYETANHLDRASLAGAIAAHDRAMAHPHDERGLQDIGGELVFTHGGDGMRYAMLDAVTLAPQPGEHDSW